MKKHIITLPDPNQCTRQSHWRIHRYSTCFRALPIYRDDIEIRIDDGTLAEKMSHRIDMGDENGYFSAFFAIDDHPFMIVDTDHPIKNHKRWVSHYESKGVKGYFLWCHRYSTQFIFDNCNVSVFPLGGKPGPYLPLSYLEGEAYSRSMTTKKDINVFFKGQFRHRPARGLAAKQIIKNIPDVYIQDEKARGTSMVNKQKSLSLTGKEYVDLMIRSKIVWCPRSAWSDPDHDANAHICKEYEAMCVGCLVIKHPIGTIEVEERIPGVHFVEIKNNDEDLVEKIQYYLEHEDERKEIARNGRLYYEKNCSTIARAYRMFDDCMKAIDA